MNVLKTRNKNKKDRIKPDYSCEQFKKWLFDYKLFVVLCSIVVVVTSFTMWDNRPNSMRTPNYVNTIDYSTVDGSYDFGDFYTQMKAQKNALVSKVHFKLSEEFCYNINDLTFCISGYELFETERDVTLKSSYRMDKSKYFLVAKIELLNDRKSVVETNGIYAMTNSEYDSSIAVRNSDIKLDNNFGDVPSDDMIKIKPGEEYSGYILFAISPTNFRQLYFDGSALVEFPEVKEQSQANSQSLITYSTEFELPIVKEVEEKYLASVNDLPTDLSRGMSGFSTDVTGVSPNVTLMSQDESLSITVERMEVGTFKYRPEYIAKHRYLDEGEKRYYKSVRVRVHNDGSTIMSTGSLHLSLEIKENSIERKLYPVTRNFVIAPGESTDIIFNYTDFSGRDMSSFDKDATYRVLLSNDNNVVLIEDFFEIEE